MHLHHSEDRASNASTSQPVVLFLHDCQDAHAPLRATPTARGEALQPAQMTCKCCTKCCSSIACPKGPVSSFPFCSWGVSVFSAPPLESLLRHSTGLTLTYLSNLQHTQLGCTAVLQNSKQKQATLSTLVACRQRRLRGVTGALLRTFATEGFDKAIDDVMFACRLVRRGGGG